MFSQAVQRACYGARLATIDANAPAGPAMRPSRSHPFARPARNKGFTLVQMLVCVAVIGILAAISTPYLPHVLQRQRALTTQHALVGHLHLARNSAIWQRKNTVLCPSTNGRECAGNTDWGSGWLVFIDANGNGRPDHHADIIRTTLHPAHTSLRIHSGAGRSNIRYLPDGRSAGSNTTISICNDTDILLMQVVVNNAGRVRNAHPRADQPCR
ncbi:MULTISPECIES: GspH/FimT family pseudopilin [Stenotrophomonas]|uniref:GspH/FimT family pseudopilin n=1 Tax=Stenotrophomonas TaxID=40323 RepID=UPI0009EB1214|nr:MULTISPECIES: GspH/FimT family pseudopilin [Stenotrophomonas]